MPPRLAARRSGRRDVVQDSLIRHTLAASLRQACFCFVHNSTGAGADGFPVQRLRSSTSSKTDRALHHGCVVLEVQVSALWLAHASPRLTPVLARIMNFEGGPAIP